MHDYGNCPRCHGILYPYDLKYIKDKGCCAACSPLVKGFYKPKVERKVLGSKQKPIVRRIVKGVR